MADEDADRLNSPSFASPAGHVGDTRFSTAPSSAAGSTYELHVLPEKARHTPVATSETRPDDGHPVFCASRSNTQHRDEMSRAPLLVRSSPAQGTGKLFVHAIPARFIPDRIPHGYDDVAPRHSIGSDGSIGSYGGLPILSMSPDDSDEHHVTRNKLRGKKKGKSRLATSIAAQRSREFEHEFSSQSDSSSSRFATSRRQARDERRSSRTLLDNFEGQDGACFEARFNASGCDPSVAGVPTQISGSETSSFNAHPGEGEDSESDDLHDTKGNPTDDSPYAQVRASVKPTDNTSLSIDTPRMWFLSIIFAIAGSSTNLFFSLRYPSVSLTPIIALLLVHPLGLLWDQIFKRHDDPEEVFLNGCLLKSTYSAHAARHKHSWRRRLRLWLAQGQWNEKEHCCVYVSSNVSFGFAFATDVSG